MLEYKVLYRKYRPDNFDNIVDQDVIINTLKNAINNNKVAHAYIFSGPRGTGKTTTAKVFAKALNCDNYDNGPCGKCQNCLHAKSNPDVIEIDAASNNGVDDVRELINNVRIAPSVSKYKIYIIDEVHMLTTSAFNALLLTLEEPPQNVVFILATTNIESVPITILSRCQRFDFNKISNDALLKRLKYIISEEKIDIDDAAIEEICQLSEGGLRDALGMLDQLSSQNSKITVDIVQNSYSVVSSEIIKKIVDMIINCDKDGLISIIDNIEQKGYDFKNVNKKIIRCLYNRLIKDAEGESVCFIKQLIMELNRLMNDINIYVSPYLLLKTIMISNVYNHNLNCEQIMSKNIKEEDNLIIKNVNELENTQNSRTNVQNYFPGNNFDEKLASLKQIRINNSFVEPSKEILKENQENWSKYIKNLDDSNLMSLLIDSKLVVSSNKYAIISTELEATSHLINTCVSKVEKGFNAMFNSSIKFISVSSDEWNKLKTEYVKNIKNNTKYKFVEETKIEYNEEALKNIAKDVFKNIEIEVE